MRRVEWFNTDGTRRDKKTYPYHKDDQGNWEKGKGDRVWKPYAPNLINVEVKDSVLLAVEGEKSVDECSKRGIAAIDFSSEYVRKEQKLEILQQLKAQGLKALAIIQDNDDAGKAKALKVESLANDVGLPSVIISIPQLLPNAQEKDDIVEVFEQWEKEMLDNTDYIKRLEREISLSLKKKYLEAEGVKVSDTVTHYELDVSQKLVSNKKRLTHEDVAKILIPELKSNLRFDVSKQAWRQWQGTHWVDVSDIAVQKAIIDILTNKGIPYDTIHFVKSVRELLSNLIGELKWKSLPRDKFINYLNGTYDIETEELRPHNPKDGFTSVLPYSKGELEVTPSDSIESLQVNCPNTYKFLSHCTVAIAN